MTISCTAGSGARRDLWVGWKPNGLGEQKPNHYSDISRIAWENRRNLPWAWRILSKGVCDGCALGVAGFHDWTISGVHLCTTRLELLKVNTARAIPDDALQDVAALTKYNGRELRELGRLAHPMVRYRGDRGFRRVSWDDALDLVATRIRAAGPNRLGLYLTAAASPTRCTTPHRRRSASSARTTSTTRRACVTRRLRAR